MARTAVEVTTFTGNIGVTEPAGTDADPTNGHVISGVPTEELLIRFANTNGTDRVATIVAGDNPPADAAGQGKLDVTVPATTGVVWVGPLTSARFSQDDGTVLINLAASFAGTVTAYRVIAECLMADTRFFRTSSGVIMQMDVPSPGTMQRERHDEKVAAGELCEVSRGLVRVDIDEHSYRWELSQDVTMAPASVDVPDEQLLDDTSSDGVPDGGMAEILEWVGGDPARAVMALDVEQAGKARSSLITRLQAVTNR